MDDVGYVDIVWTGINRDFTSTLGKFKRGTSRRITEADAKWLLTLSDSFKVSEAVYGENGKAIGIFSAIDIGMLSISNDNGPLDLGIARSYGFGDMLIAVLFACQNAKLQNAKNKVTLYVPPKYKEIFELFPYIDVVGNYPPSYDMQKEHDMYIDLTRVPEFHSNDSRNHCRAEIFASIFEKPRYEYNPLIIPEENIDKAKQLIDSRNTEKRKVIALATTSISQIKTYPAALLKRLIEILIDEYFVVMYGTDDHKWGLRQWNGTNLLSLVNKTPNYIDLAALLAQSDYGIATDSGLMHLLAVLKISTLALFGNLDPMAMIKYYPTVTALYPRSELPCIPCGNKFNPCPKTDAPFGGGCLNLLDPERVMKAFNSSILGIGDDEQTIFRKVMRINTSIGTKTSRIVHGYSPSKTSIEEKPKYNVLIVVPHIFMGGGETQLVYLLDALGDYDFNIEIIVMGSIDDDLFPVLAEKAEINVIATGGNKADTLRRKIVDDEIDIVMFHGTDLLRFALEGLKQKPVIIQILHTGVGSWTVDVLKMTAVFDDHVIAVAEWIRRKFKLQYPLLEITAINNGAPITSESEGDNLRQKLQIKKDDFVIGAMSRFGGEKRLHLLIQALKYLPSNVSLLFAGWGAMEDELKQLASEIAFDRVKFAGVIHDREVFFRTVDACALVSVAEGNSMFLLEAAMAKKPIITTAVGAAPDLFKDKYSAMFVDGNPESIAEAITELMLQNELFSTIGIRAREMIERHASDISMASGYRMVFYHELQRRINPRHILCYRIGGHGDMAMTVPALKVLRKKYPDAIITFATSKIYAEILRGLPYIDNLIARDIINFNSMAHNYDLAFNFQHLEVWDSHQHIIEHYLELVDAPLKSDTSLEVCLDGVKSIPIEPPYVCIHTTSNFQCKDWGFEGEWREIVRYLQEKYTVVQLGSANEPDYGGIMLSRKGISIKESIKVLEGAEFLVGIDSFPVHGAKVVKCKSVVIYGGASHPDFCGYEENENVISSSPCQCDLSKTMRIDCTKGLICLKSITVNDVIGAIGRMEAKLT